MTTMNPQQKCPTCGAPLNAVDELCSNCLIQAGLDETVVLPAEQSSGLQTLSGDETSDHHTWDYEILKEIAQGGMGVVYKARQKKLNRVVALKMLLAGAFARQDVLKRFLSEAEVVAHLDHPNIVPIYEIGRHEGQTFFTMKFIENGTLRDSIPALKAHPRKAVQLMVKVVRAVHFAHQRGVLHRDIKPGNILIDSKGEPWVSDFGLAKKAGDDVTLTRTGAILGTPAYMAPEQARAGQTPLTVAADVYSLGAVLYHIFTGHPPFETEDPLALLQSLQSDEPRNPKSINPALPDDLVTICLKCLEKHPLQRYSSAEALCQDLERWLDYQPIEARPTGFWERRVKWVRRKPTIAFLSILVVLLSIFGVGGLFLQTYQKQQALEQARQSALELAMARAPKLTARNIMRHNDRAASVVFNQDGTRLLSSSKDQVARVWNPFTGELLLELVGSQGALSRAEFSPDETKILTVSVDEGFYYPHMTPAGLATASFEGPWNGENKVRIWDAQSGELLHELLGHDAQVTDACFSSDGKRVVTGALDKKAIVWNAETGQSMHVLEKHKASIASVQFTPDGRFVVTTSLGKYLDIEVKEGPNNSFSRSANTLTEHEPQLAVFWDVQTGQPVHTFNNQAFKIIGGTEVFDSSRSKVSFSHDGRYAVTAAELPENTCLWDMDTFEPLATLQGHQHTVLEAAFSPDSQWIATACADHMTRIYRVTNGALVHELQSHLAPVLGVSFSSNNERLLSVSADGTGKIWDIHSGYLMATLGGHQDRVVDGVFHPNGFHIATASRDHTVRMWESGTLEDLVQTYEGHRNGIVDLAWHPDGKYLASAGMDRTARVWSLDDADFSSELKGQGPDEEAAYQRLLGGVVSVAFTTDGSRLWTGSDDSDGSYRKKIGPVSVGNPIELPFTPARLWDWRENKMKWGVTGLLSGIQGAYPDPTGQYVVLIPNGHYKDVGMVDPDGSYPLGPPKTAFVSTSPVLYHVPERQLEFEFTGVQGVVDQVEFSQDGHLVAFRGNEQPVQIFRLPEGTLVKQWGETIVGHFLAFSSDSRHIMFASHSKKLEVWDVHEDRLVLELQEFDAPLIGAWFLEKEHQILSLTHQGEWTRWDFRSGEALKTFTVPSSKSVTKIDYRVVRLSPNGRLLAMVPHQNRQLLELWDVRTHKQIVGIRAHTQSISALEFSPDSHWLATASNDDTVKAWPVGLFVSDED